MFVRVEVCVSFRLPIHGLSGVPIGALLVVLQQGLFVLRLFVARFWLADVWLKCSLQSYLKCVAFCRVWVWRYFVASQNVGGRHSAAGSRRVVRALLFWRSGASGMGAKAVNKKSTCFGVMKTSAHCCVPVLTTGYEAQPEQVTLVSSWDDDWQVGVRARSGSTTWVWLFPSRRGGKGGPGGAQGGGGHS